MMRKTSPPDVPAAPGKTLAMGPAEWTMLLVLSVLWGGSFFFIGVAVRQLPTLSIVALRVTLAALVLWGVILVSGRKVPRGARVWLAFLGMGAINNAIPFGLIVWGQQTISSGLASILNATTPLFAVLVAGMLLSDERLSAQKITGVVIGFIGVSVMIGWDAFAGLSSDALAEAAILGGALAYAFAGVYGRRFKRLGVDPIMTATGQVSAATLLLIPAALVVDRPWALQMPSAATWGAIAGLAALSTALAYILYFQILARAGATNVLLVTFLIPVSAILLGTLFLGERLTWIEGLGMVLISAGLAVMDGRLLRLIRARGPRAQP